MLRRIKKFKRRECGRKALWSATGGFGGGGGAKAVNFVLVESSFSPANTQRKEQKALIQFTATKKFFFYRILSISQRWNLRSVGSTESCAYSDPSILSGG
ncbi:unnamed protein product [Striga asiatica]|uniref:Uncharacterized protein n=1 Tax=Striga asiatica TaxID=4170 RepID=A0A5A7PCS3_STRAF|nr:unnamed protein product [Striga asiatica]